MTMITELNMQFNIPWNDFMYLMVLGIILASLAPPFSIRLVNKLSVSEILKSI